MIDEFKFVYNGALYVNLYDKSASDDIGEIDWYVNKIVDLLSNSECRNEITNPDELQLRCLLKNIRNHEGFNCALFIVRNLLKIKIYDRVDKFDFDLSYKVINYLFLLDLDTNFKGNNTCISQCLNENLLLILKMAYNITINYYMSGDGLYNKNAIQSYRERRYYVTTIKGDMNSYKIKCKFLVDYVRKFRKFSARLVPGYIRESQLKLLLKRIEKYALNRIEDDAICVCKNDFVKRFDERILDYINRFEVKYLQQFTKNPFDERWDFICCYKTEKYYIISQNLLKRNASIIKSLCECCCGSESFFKVFFDYIIDDRFKRDYDEYMVYKIADILFRNDYFIPTEKKGNVDIPKVNIKKYLKNRCICINNGDIDVVFFSPQTRVIYLIEYKNIQMVPSRLGDLKYDIRKMENLKIYKHVKARETLVKGDIHEFIEQVFGKEQLYVQEFNDIKSIILTTKPNFYFYQYPSDDFLCMDWIEFVNRVTRKEL